MAKRKVVTDHQIWVDTDRKVVFGCVRRRGRPGKVAHLFKCVGEKLPLAALEDIRDALAKEFKRTVGELKGVYLAHDSFGVARYGGRGQIFGRLRSHREKHKDELAYFSFYIIETKRHEREIETAIIRAAESQMFLNERKVHIGAQPGRVTDYEPGTFFFERQRKRGKRKKVRRSRRRRVGT